MFENSSITVAGDAHDALLAWRDIKGQGMIIFRSCPTSVPCWLPSNTSALPPSGICAPHLPPGGPGQGRN